MMIDSGIAIYRGGGDDDGDDAGTHPSCWSVTGRRGGGVGCGCGCVGDDDGGGGCGDDDG